MLWSMRRGLDSRPLMLATYFALAVLLVPPVQPSDSAKSVPLEEFEARALVAMIPEVHQARIHGFEVLYGLSEDNRTTLPTMS